MDVVSLFNLFFPDFDNTIEKDGKIYRVKLEEIEKEDTVNVADIKKDIDSYVEDIDAEIWNDATVIFSRKYNIAYFDNLLKKDVLTKDEFSKLVNAFTALKECVADAAQARINYLTDKYLSSDAQTKAKVED